MPALNGAGSRGLPESLKKPAVMCNEAAIRILGLSLAGWNALICAGLAMVAARGARVV
jgi:disulfide bond formation protein DsbB